MLIALGVEKVKKVIKISIGSCSIFMVVKSNTKIKPIDGNIINLLIVNFMSVR